MACKLKSLDYTIKLGHYPGIPTFAIRESLCIVSPHVRI